MILPKLAFTGFASRYHEPRLSEGFTEIIMTDFEVRTTRAGLLVMQALGA
jgi:bifunctional polynucleotide phosphatase/kinase